jgi:hypothetical protein
MHLPCCVAVLHSAAQCIQDRHPQGISHLTRVIAIEMAMTCSPQEAARSGNRGGCCRSLADGVVRVGRVGKIQTVCTAPYSTVEYSEYSEMAVRYLNWSRVLPLPYFSCAIHPPPSIGSSAHPSISPGPVSSRPGTEWNPYHTAIPHTHHTITYHAMRGQAIRTGRDNPSPTRCDSDKCVCLRRTLAGRIQQGTVPSEDPAVVGGRGATTPPVLSCPAPLSARSSQAVGWDCRLMIW